MEILTIDETPRNGRLLRPRLGFVGLGWIGRKRLAALVESRAADAVALADPADQALERARQIAPGAAPARSFEELLEHDLDGVVIATPNALHAEQAQTALERGVAVFCQKPLARTAAEAAAVVRTARTAGRLLAVDLCYRSVAGVPEIRRRILDGELGDVYAADLLFHNAYGPGKAWFYDLALAGGGCLMDLGIHLVDLALWTLGYPRVVDAESVLLSRGAPLGSSPDQTEDYATVTLRLACGAASETGTVVRVGCSWNLHAGHEAVIQAQFFGTDGGASLRNVDGSFYDFVAEHTRGTSREAIAEPPDAWGGRSLVRWARRLAAGAGFDPDARHLVTLHETLDRLYGRVHDPAAV